MKADIVSPTRIWVGTVRSGVPIRKSRP